MGDYNFTRLNPRDFEHLTQALAMNVIASGIIPFGDGPDGAREATYRGAMNYPSPAAPWNGYLVIQSKFLGRPSGEPAKDGGWVLKQLETDLKKFLDVKRNLPKPDYYLLVTNAVLTPAQNTGTKDKAFKMLERYSNKLGLKDYDIWDYDKLCRLIDGNQAIAKKYAAFITPGDVLSTVIKMLEYQNPDFLRIMSLFLQRELRNDQFAKLEQAGHTADQKTALANVFIDLPSLDRPQADPPEEKDSKLPPGIVHELLQAGSEVLRPSTATSSVADSQAIFRPRPGRYVLIGGPGQGKSTIGQFICQLHRASILKERPAHTISTEATSILMSLEAECKSNNLAVSCSRRFPFRIVLDQFANELASRTATSLLSYIIRRIAIATDYDCSVNDLRRWLESYPWLLVLDGLDEVPSTSNRQQVLDAVNDFWDEVASLDADVLVLATTRPQGYNDDFSPSLYNHRYLAPLSVARAMHYASRLIETRFSAEFDRKERIKNRLTAALAQPSTSRLMRSPLQVTIMTTLVDQIGQPPQERWRLFQQYYEVIYRRETERDIPASVILQQRRADVNAIHNRLGLLLQIESELEGNTESKISAERFGKLVAARISEEGFEGPELELRTQEIIQAALLRLVFLVGLEENAIGFEIRSLQEYTAAEALMDGGDEQVKSRLHIIASSPHWRNVFLFAAGKCFAERQFLRDMIVTMCDQLNDKATDKLAGYHLAGSRLALDILNDGVAREQPIYARSLARVAIRLVETDDENAIQALATAYQPSMESVFKEKIQQQLLQPEWNGKRGSWIILGSLADKDVSWAISLMEEQWPKELEYQRQILFEFTGVERVSEWAANKLLQLLPVFSPKDVAIRYVRAHGETSFPDNFPEWASAAYQVQSFLFPEAYKSLIMRHARATFEARIISIKQPYLEPLKDMPLLNPDWLPFILAGRLSSNTTTETLADALQLLSKHFTPQQYEEYIYKSGISWPLYACLHASKSQGELALLSERIRAGSLGQGEDWIKAEKIFAAGVEFEDMLQNQEKPWSFNALDKSIQIPITEIDDINSTDPNQTLLILLSAYERANSAETKSGLAQIIYSTLRRQAYRRISYSKADYKDHTKMPLVPSSMWAKILRLSREQSIELEVLDELLPPTLTTDWINLVNELGGSRIRPLYGYKKTYRYIRPLLNAFIQDPSLYGILKILGQAALQGHSINVPEHSLNRVLTDDIEARFAVEVLRLTNSKWKVDAAPELAEKFSSYVGSASGFFLLPNRIVRLNISLDKKLTFLTSLLDKVKLRDPLLSSIVGSSLEDLIKNRPTHIRERRKWRELKLPVLS